MPYKDEDGPFTVELDEPGCEKCGHGEWWSVVDNSEPEPTELSEGFSCRDDAEDHCDTLNWAWLKGFKRGREDRP